MPRYVGLFNWTDQGIRQVKETLARSDQNRQLVEQFGGRLETVLWTMGRYDVVAIFEAPDDETASAVTLRIGASGMARTETLRAYTAEEMGSILDKLG
jgi:uncharacterized protein with GYD domain